ncbi:MAG TPA: hypothetical protein VMY37_15660 [Thermoguttaceae bacterium]|nr:hypothetical protein [Thermoguttaceae bacterium]
MRSVATCLLVLTLLLGPALVGCGGGNGAPDSSANPDEGMYAPPSEAPSDTPPAGEALPGD